MSDTANVGKVFNLTGSGSGDSSLKLESLSITTPPTKTTYKSGESFDPTGMVVTASHTYGITSTVTGYTYSPHVLTDDISEVTISYSEGRITKTATVAVTVEKVLSSIEVTTPPTKTSYDYLESFDATGMVVTANYSDGSSEAVEGYSYSSSALSTLGSNDISISYTYEEVTKETSVSITVNAISVAIPTQTNVPTYDGTSQSPTWENYDSVKMTMTGDTSGINAKSNYSVTFTLNYGYVFPDGTDEAVVKWAINRATIDALPVQTDVPAADGTVKSPSWSGYDATKMTIGGDQSGTEPGDYTATFTPTSNYQWWDSTTAAKSVIWTIASILVTIPSQTNVPTYDGSAKTPEWSNFDSEYSTVDVTAATEAGEHTATFSLLEGMWEDGTTEDKTVKWTINRASIAAVPTQSGTCVYNGDTQTPTWDSSYNSSKMTLSVEAKVNAGEHTATFTPTSNYQWWDGTTSAKTVTWVISKASNTVTLSPTSLTLNSSATTGSFTVSRNGDGTITAVSSDTSVATVDSINQSSGVITIGSVDETTGTAVITVSVGESDNYLAVENVTLDVTAQFVTIYGVEWDWTSSGPTAGTRTDAAANFSDPSPAVSSGDGSSPFDNLYPWCDMTKETRTGGVMVKEPKYYFKWTKTDKKLKLQIADGYVEGFHVDPVNMDKGDGLGELDYSYIGRYHCATSTYKSTTGVAQACSITRSSARSSIHSLGDNIWQIDFAQMWYVGMLFLVEFADWNGEKIGRGCSSSGSKANNGQTDSMTYHTGTTASSRDSYGFTQYRNIEGWWDNVYDWMDGCYYTSSGLNVILNPNNFSDSANGTLIGSMPSSGYPTDMALCETEGYEWAVRPASTGGSVTTYVPDYWYFSGSGPCLCRGGSFSRYQSLGPFCVYCYSTSDTSGSIGCRLQERPPKAA